MRKKLRALGRYVGHLLVGAAMFTPLLLFGMSLRLLVRWSAPIDSDPPFSQWMGLVEKVMLYCDVALVVRWVVYSTYTAIKEVDDK